MEQNASFQMDKMFSAAKSKMNIADMNPFPLVVSHIWYQSPNGGYLAFGWSKASKQFPVVYIPVQIQCDFFMIFLRWLPCTSKWSKIRNPVLANFKHVPIIGTCTLLWCNVVTYVPMSHCEISKILSNAPVWLIWGYLVHKWVQESVTTMGSNFDQFGILTFPPFFLSHIWYLDGSSFKKIFKFGSN